MERVELVAGLSKDEAAALAYFAMGVASEGSSRGRNVAYRLSFAGNGRESDVLRPLGNSGFSIGTLQTDLGQRPAAAHDLVAAYRAWSLDQTAPRPIEPGDDVGWQELERLLARNGRTIEREGGRNIAPAVRQDIDRFLASERGIDFVHDRDVAQVEHLLRPDSTRNRSALHAIGHTLLYRDAGDADRVRLAALFLKLENQSGRAIYPGLVQRIERGELDSVDAIRHVIDARGDNVTSGMHHTLAGTEAYLALRDMSSGNPLHEAGRKVLAAPLASPASLEAGGDAARPSIAEYHAVKTLFVQPATAVQFLHALDRGGAYAYGRIGRGQTGFFASGNDFAYWDGDGRGHAGGTGGWREVARDDMRRVNHRDGRVELLERTALGEEPLLRIDRTAAPLRPSSGAVIDHPLHEQVRLLTEASGTTRDPTELQRITASLMHATTAAGLQHIHHLALHDGHLVAWDRSPRDPAARWSSVSLEESGRTHINESLAALARLDSAAPPLRDQPAVHEPAPVPRTGFAPAG